MSDTMEITLNGKPAAAPSGCTVEEVLDVAGLAADRRAGIAIALNQTVVSRSLWSSTIISAGDRIEIVTAVQGG